MGCQEGGGNTLLSAVEADPPDIGVIYEVRPGWHLRSGDPASLAVLADPRDIDNTVGRMDPPMQTRLVEPRGLDNMGESMPGCLEGGEGTPRLLLRPARRTPTSYMR